MYWKVGELAKLANISVRTLHHYEEIGLLVPVERTASGYRLYDENNVLKLMQILCLSRVGMSLQEVDVALKAYPDGILDALKQQLNALSVEIKALQQLESQLASIVEKILSNQMPTWQDWKMNQELIAIYDEFFAKTVRKQKMTIQIEEVNSADYLRLQEIWESAVLATHDFLQEADFKEIQTQLIPAYFPQVILYKAKFIEDGEIAGFLGVSDNRIEMLFIDDQFRGQGIGKALLRFGIDHLKANELDVNEQNEQALAFYQHHGFEVIKRSELDGSGKPYPTLTMKLPAVK